MNGKNAFVTEGYARRLSLLSVGLDVDLPEVEVAFGLLTFSSLDFNTYDDWDASLGWVRSQVDRHSIETIRAAVDSEETYELQLAVLGALDGMGVETSVDANMLLMLGAVADGPKFAAWADDVVIRFREFE